MSIMKQIRFAGSRAARAPHRSAQALLCALAALAAPAIAGPREQAKRMHDRIAGVPPSPALLDEMESR